MHSPSCRRPQNGILFDHGGGDGPYRGIGVYNDHHYRLLSCHVVLGLEKRGWFRVVFMAAGKLEWDDVEFNVVPFKKAPISNTAALYIRRVGYIDARTTKRTGTDLRWC